MRNSYGFTLPFALVLTFIFSGLVAVSYVFVSINLKQMQSNLWNIQAVSIAEGINERVKARLNTKTKPELTPEQEKNLKDPATDDDEGDLIEEDEFDESTEEFDEYYADEILKISRYITFREPPPDEEAEDAESGRPKDANAAADEEVDEESEKAKRAEANVAMVGDIEVPEGTVLEKKVKLVILHNEKISLMLKDITTDSRDYKPKLPLPKIKSITPNYSEANKKSSFTVKGENLPRNEPSFNDKKITILDFKSKSSIEYQTDLDLMPGLKRFMWDTAQAEFYIIPTFENSIKPVIKEVVNSDGTRLLEIKAGKRNTTIMIYGTDLFLKKATPVVLPDVCGLIPRVKGQSQNGTDLTVSLDVGREVEPGTHSLIVATEGGLSNTWIFNVLPPDDRLEDPTYDTAIVSSSLTLLEVKVLDKILPLINDEDPNDPQNNNAAGRPNDSDSSNDPNDPSDPGGKELSEKDKIGKFGNTDLETVWLLETTAMIGMTTKTVSEVVHREIPNITAALVANSKITFEGGSYQINGNSTSNTKLIEPTYLSNTILKVEGPPEEPEEPVQTDPASQNSSGGRPGATTEGPKSPEELGFKSGNLVAVYKDGNKIEELDYAKILNVGRDTIELIPPGIMDYHFEGDTVIQFIPPIISREKLSDDDNQFHTNPKGLSIAANNAASFRNLFNSNIEQFAEVADLFTNDPSTPHDEYDLPIGYMGLTYIEGTPKYDNSNALTGKGLLIIDTRPGNLGKPTGDVEFNGDGKSPIDFMGIVYVHGNLKVNGSVNITGALIVDNESMGEITFANNATGMIAYDEQAIRQTILSIPFTTKPGTVMITNKPIDLSAYIEGAVAPTNNLGQPVVVPQADGSQNNEIMGLESVMVPDLPPEEAIIETVQPSRPLPDSDNEEQGKTAEEELIDLF